MKKILLFITLAVGFTIAQTDEPVYDDYNRCNTSGATLAPEIYIQNDQCEQTGYVCRLESQSSGMVVFWLGSSADCRKMHTTKMTTYYPIKNQPSGLDYNHPNHELRLVLSPNGANANAFGVAVMASQLVSAKSDGAKVSVIYSFEPGSFGPDLNSIRLQSVSRID